ncbi:MAG: hypothetical protein LUD78_07660 [Clostridiales bacterium]|nr:hypothetical protein [Clostridiales bacterium]
MATKNELKTIIDKMAEMMDSVGKAVGVKEGTGKAFKGELAMFLMYLSASDGEIKWDEASVISDLCDLNLTPQSIGDFIRKNNIYSTEFESKVPATLDLIVKADNLLIKMNMDNGLSDVPNLVISTYKYAAEQLIMADGTADANEHNDCKIYIDMMERYVRNNSDRRKSSVSGFTKNTGGVSAPTKSGVSAPTKSGVSAPKKKG